MFFVNVPLCVLVIAAVIVALPGHQEAHGTQSQHHGFPATEYALVTGGSALPLIGLQGASLGIGAMGGVAAAALGLAALALIRRLGGSLIPRAMFSRTPSGSGTRHHWRVRGEIGRAHV